VAPLTRVRVPWSELRDADDASVPLELSLDTQVGRGGFGGVYRAQLHGSAVAVKVLDLGALGSVDRSSFIKEV